VDYAFLFAQMMQFQWEKIKKEQILITIIAKDAVFVQKYAHLEQSK